MTYPPGPQGPYQPQQPGPYGQQGGPYGQQPPPTDPYGQQPAYGRAPEPYPPQTGYQGLGSYPSEPSPPPPPPRKSRTGKIIAIVVIAVLVLGGAGTAIYFVTKKDDPATTSTGNQGEARPQPPNNGGDDQPPEEPPGADDPAEVQQAYIQAYERKQFSGVVNAACEAYKKKFGTDTTDLEKQLAPYDIKATADGEPEVSGASATARIDLELTRGAEIKKPKIKIKIVKESGKWKFCGEGEA